MSLVEDYHAQHKARLLRLGGLQPSSLSLEYVRKIEALKKEIEALTEQNRSQEETIQEQRRALVKYRAFVSKFSNEEEVSTPTVRDIINAVAEHYRLSPQTVTGPCKTSNIVFPRQIGYYLGRKYGHSLHHIGRAFRRDHSSALHGSKKIEGQAKVDPELCAKIAAIDEILPRVVKERIAASKAFRP